MPRLVVKGHRLPLDETSELVGQVGGGGQPGAADEDGNHGDLMLQGPVQLEADVVLGIEQPGSALPLGGLEPARPMSARTVVDSWSVVAGGREAGPGPIAVTSWRPAWHPAVVGASRPTISGGGR